MVAVHVVGGSIPSRRAGLGGFAHSANEVHYALRSKGPAEGAGYEKIRDN